MLVETILDNAQEFLHDDGDIWPRTELLSWLNDGYRQLIAQSHAVVRPFQIDVPGRHTWAATQEWEDQYGLGIFRKFTLTIESARVQACSRWECEFIEGITPTTSLESATQLWERSVSESNNENRFMFVLSRAHEMPVKVYWDDKRLVGASSRELDLHQTEWWQQPGMPIFFFPSVGGRDGSYEVYQLLTSYSQGYELQFMENGIPREFSGERTYDVASGVDRWAYAYTDGGDAGMSVGLGLRITGQATDSAKTFFLWSWEEDLLEGETTFANGDPIGTFANESMFGADEITLSVGMGRMVNSEDRQYIPAPYDSGTQEICGIPRDFKTSEDSLTIWEAIAPTRELTESDVIALIPQQMAKYLKFYVLSRAFSRKGQGFRPDMAQHFQSFFQIGLALLTKIGNQGFIDRVYGRQSFTGSPIARPPRVQFPTNFERVW